MADISIKLKIADREYPLRVSAEDEEIIRRAGRVLNERLKSYQERFNLDDKQDLLAMVAFDCWMEKTRQEDAITDTEQLTSQRLASWEGLLSQALME